MLVSNYADWKYCIEEKCGVTLTPSFIENRVAALSDEQSAYASEFICLYGKDYHRSVLGWFMLAADEMKR